MKYLSLENSKNLNSSKYENCLDFELYDLKYYLTLATNILYIFFKKKNNNQSDVIRNKPCISTHIPYVYVYV